MPERANELDRQVGSRIRELRVQRGMSQIELASRIGTSYQQLHKYERGHNRVSVGRLGNIVEALNVSMTDFFAGLSEIAEGDNELRTLHLNIARSVQRINDTARLRAVKTVVEAMAA